jgi:amino-acid N-acetyltransferase
MRRRGPVIIRSADASHAKRLHALITANLDEGHLLPRTLPEIKTHADRFVIGMRGSTIVGCAELAPLGAHLAEVRSLAVDAKERGSGVGTSLVEEVRRRARRDGYEKLCVFTHAPGYFIEMGFSIVPHLWLLEKLFTDCRTCPRFHHCGQYAMVVLLDDARARAQDDTRSRPLDQAVNVVFVSQ